MTDTEEEPYTGGTPEELEWGVKLVNTLGPMEHWPMEIMQIHDSLHAARPPTYPGDMHPFEFLKALAEWFERGLAREKADSGT